MFAFVSAFPKSLHCTDEAQQAETVLSAVLSIYIYIYILLNLRWRQNNREQKRDTIDNPSSQTQTSRVQKHHSKLFAQVGLFRNDTLDRTKTTNKDMQLYREQNPY